MPTFTHHTIAVALNNIKNDYTEDLRDGVNFVRKLLSSFSVFVSIKIN